MERNNDISATSLTGERFMLVEKDPGIAIEHLHRYIFASQFCKNRRVLDLACGEGYGSNILAREASEVTGIDHDPGITDHAAGKYKAKNLHFTSGRAEKIPLADQSIDVAVSFETLEHVQSQDAMLAEIRRVLIPGGLLVISTPDKKYYTDETNYRNPFHVKELYQNEFIALLEKYFSPVKLLSQYADGLSVIYKNEPGNTWYAEGDIKDYNTQNNIPAKYMIAFAGNEIAIPAISIFNGRIMEEQINGRELESVINSRTYLVGKMITAPYRWLKKLFGSTQTKPQPDS